MGFKDSIVAPMLKFIVRRMSRARLPRTSGELRVEGLDTPVEVLRDEWGVPHIYASSEHDLFLAQGFVHAQDRFCQMEFSRRLAQGRLAEVFGPDAVPVDRLARTLGFGRLGQADLDRTDPETATMLEAYAAGVNAWMAGEDFRNPVEFRLVRHRVERWSAVNALQFGHVMFWQLSRGWSSELARARLVEAVGAERATEIEVEPSESDPPTLPEGARFFRLGPDGVLEAFTGPFLQNGLGSNGVVVAGSRTATGRPFLSNDMHLPLVLPSFWYQNHLVGGGIEATGVSLPGMPCVIAGHDARIAWGMTLSYGDCEDLFVERFDPARPSWYEHAGAFREAEVRREEILVKGRAEPVVEEVVTTCHGPVISGVFGLDNRLSIASTALRSFNCARGWLLLNRAGDWNGFLDAMRAMEAPPLNVVYADIDGNIGYRVAGVVPVRGRGDGSVPAPGWTGEHDWVGMVPFEEMPGALNPPSGVIVSCNHRIMPSGAGPWMGNAYMSGWRARRIGEMVGDRTGLGSADFKAIQADVTSIPAREILKRIEGLPCKDPDARTALETMSGWDGRLDAESAAAAVYGCLKLALATNLVEPALGAETALRRLGQGFHPLLNACNEFYNHDMTMVIRHLDDPDSWWVKTAGGRDHWVERSLGDAVRRLRELQGPDKAGWKWGRIHRAVFVHGMGVKPPFDRVFNTPPVAVGGDSDTPCQTAMLPHEPFDARAWAPTFRQVVDLSDWSRSEVIFAPGQSGEPGSPHYADLLGPWARGEYHRMTWPREDVEREAVARLVLVC